MIRIDSSARAHDAAARTIREMTGSYDSVVGEWLRSDAKDAAKARAIRDRIETRLSDFGRRLCGQPMHVCDYDEWSAKLDAGCRDMVARYIEILYSSSCSST